MLHLDVPKEVSETTTHYLDVKKGGIWGTLIFPIPIKMILWEKNFIGNAFQVWIRIGVGKAR